MQKRMFVVMNEAGVVVAAARESQGDQKSLTHLAPHAGQNMYLVDVSGANADLENFADGNKFHKAITNHFHSKHANPVLVTPSSHPYCFRFRNSK